jgi:ABC-type phosphate transport system permease subunit
MNNTLNNNSSKTSKARQICTFSNLYDPIINVGYKGVYPPIESTFSSRELAMFMAFSVVVRTIFVFQKIIRPKKKAPNPPRTLGIHPQHQ